MKPAFTMVLAVFTAAFVHASAAARQPQPVPAAPVPSPVPGLEYDVPFFPGATYDPAVPTVGSILGSPVGQRPATHAQIEAVIKALAQASPRAKLFEYARSHEGRTLYYLVITSEANIKRLDQIKSDMAKLADPRTVTPAEGDHLAQTLPAVAWMAYVIHGDEMSGSDGSLALAYHLCASRDEPVVKMLDDLVVIIDPLMNPDGRDRFLKQAAENRTVQPSVDDQSLLHTGSWPQGRTNHYLFDMNRDWILGVQPESRGRIAAVGSWHPQLFMESHEMGSQDTFLFSPPREPINPNLAESMKKWWDVFSKDQAAAFDRFGWRYYTGEWNEEWYPGYSSSWAGYRGALDILYEQAAISTDAVRRAEGTLMSYRESVHHQLVSSVANLTTLRANRGAVMADFLAQRRQAVAAEGPFAARTFAVIPSANRTRDAALVDLMRLQGFEVFSVSKPFTAATGKDRLNREFKDRQFPAGTILIPNRQPEARLLAAMLEFDTHMSAPFLQDERRELLRFGRSKLYDITGWSLTMFHDVEAFEVSMPLPDGATPYALPAAGGAPADPAQASVGYVIDGADDASVAGAGRLMERQVHVRVADKPFEFEQKAYARGSVVVTRVDNRMFVGDLGATVAQVVSELGVQAAPLNSGLGPGDVPDLGGEHFILLEQPRIAVLAREPVGAYGFGEVWHLVDRTLGVRASYLDSAVLNGADLRRYNVLVVPSGGGDILKANLEPIKGWVRAGGTLIAVGSSAAWLATETAGITGARLLPDVVTKLDDYAMAVVREWEGRTTVVNPDAVWAYTPPVEVTYPWAAPKSDDKPNDEEIKRRDKWRQIFMPQGTILAGRVDDRHWLTAGCGEVVPILFESSTVLMAAGPVQAPVRLGVYVAAPPAPSAPTIPGAPPPGESSQPTPPASPPPTKPEDKAKPAPPGEPAGKEAAKDGSKDAGKEGAKEAPKHAAWAPLPTGQELRLRMSGLLWPEAADRLANSAYVTREAVGTGQVILFASSPTFRGSTKGTMRIMSNAMICGPGMGASAPIKP